MRFWKALRWQIERVVAIAAYKRREAKRERARYPVVWSSHLQLVAADLALIHESTPELLSAQNVEDIAKTRNEIRASAAKFGAAITAAIAYLMLSTLDIKIPVSIAGVALTPAPGVAELATLAIAIMSAAVAGKTVAIATLSVASKTLIHRVYAPELRYFKLMQFHTDEPPSLYQPSLGSLVWSKATLFANFGYVGLAIVALLGAIGLSVGWRWLIYPELWNNPTSDPFWCRAAMLATFVIDVGWVAFIALYIIPLPHKDYAWLNALTALDSMAEGSGMASHMRTEAYSEGWRDRDEMESKGYLRPDDKI